MAPVHVDCAVKCSGGRGGVGVEGRVCVVATSIMYTVVFLWPILASVFFICFICLVV